MTDTCKEINFEFNRDRFKNAENNKVILANRLETLKDNASLLKKISISTKHTPSTSPSKLPELIVPNKHMQNAYASNMKKRENLNTLNIERQG